MVPSNGLVSHLGCILTSRPVFLGQALDPLQPWPNKVVAENELRLRFDPELSLLSEYSFAYCHHKT